MGLVDYSDSESDGESAPVAPAAKTSTQPPAAKPVFQKAAPGKIQVSLPSEKSELNENGKATDEPPAKRARTGGAFSGFNALLPAPKRAVQRAPKAGVSLKTSSEAGFSREPMPKSTADEDYSLPTSIPSAGETTEKIDEPVAEPKFVGKATRFLPLSVSAKKKKKPIAAPKPPPIHDARAITNSKTQSESQAPQEVSKEPEPQKSKPKKSLFAVDQEKDEVVAETVNGEYEPLMLERETIADAYMPEGNDQVDQTPADPNSLEAVAADMNLTPAQRRQLFGRQGKGANVQHFNLDQEYRKNEELRAAGEVVEHKAVKAIAPGKHSLQQLVNNARTQQDAMEDKWAEGRRNRGEGSSKYGWSNG